MEQKNKHIAIYKCRLCKRKFLKGDAIVDEIKELEFPTAPAFTQHKCRNGMYGVADLLGVKRIGN